MWAATRKRDIAMPGIDGIELVRRIRAQLIALGRLPDSYADGIAQQMWGTKAPTFYEWCSGEQLRGITTALGQQQNRQPQ